ncbi:hypothetical protein KY340_02030 [Candidatus Woesearchaeota archaeon]|nr:hypothetical protein [Candidatus Woesearchaeota archaeon]
MAELRKCLKCGEIIQSYSPMRKWCFECRKKIGIEQARERKIAKLKLKK